MIEGLGQRLRKARNDCGYTQEEIAGRIGLSSTSNISSYESGASTPPAEALMKMAAIYHVSVDYLLGLEKERALFTDRLTEEEIWLLSKVADKFRENR